MNFVLEFSGQALFCDCADQEARPHIPWNSHFLLFVLSPDGDSSISMMKILLQMGCLLLSCDRKIELAKKKKKGQSFR